MMQKPDLSVNLCGLKMKNPLMLASGILGETAGSMLRVANGGAGAVVTKSISLLPRDGYPNPTLVDLPIGLLNAMGLPNPGIDAFEDEMKEAVTKANVPIIASIFGKDATEFVTLAGRMEDLGASALELNLSCPHAKGYGAELGTVPETLEEITGAVCGAVDIPVFVKLTPNTDSILRLAKAAQDAGASAIVAINTVKAMAIDIEIGVPVLYNKFGGLSGPAVKPVGVRAVFELHGEIRIPIIGCGGISNGNDAIEYVMAGATALQVGSAIYYRGREAFGQISTEMEMWLASHGVMNLTQIIGKAKKKK